jgi:hypothetical protein
MSFSTESADTTLWPTAGVTTSASAEDGGWEVQQLSSGVRWLVVVAGSVLCVAGVLGNVLILLALITQRSLRSLHHLYVGSLAVADLIIMAYIVPLWLADLASGHPVLVNQLHCQLNAFMTFTCAFASLYTLVLISANRYLRACHQQMDNRVSSTRIWLLLLASSWLLSAAQSALPLLGADPNYSYYRLPRLCTFVAHGGQPHQVGNPF